jgi:hypothetical protein
MSGTDPEKLAEQLQTEARNLQAQSHRLGEEVSQAREDWERKRADPGVPGAPPAQRSAQDPSESGSPAPVEDDG